MSLGGMPCQEVAFPATFGRSGLEILKMSLMCKPHDCYHTAEDYTHYGKALKANPFWSEYEAFPGSSWENLAGSLQQFFWNILSPRILAWFNRILSNLSLHLWFLAAASPWLHNVNWLLTWHPNYFPVTAWSTQDCSADVVAAVPPPHVPSNSNTFNSSQDTQINISIALLNILEAQSNLHYHYLSDLSPLIIMPAWHMLENCFMFLSPGHLRGLAPCIQKKSERTPAISYMIPWQLTWLDVRR